MWSTHVALGPQWLKLDLDLEHWAADGLLALFFLVAGIEVKRELLVGELADGPSRVLPFAAAAGGMVLPAVVAIAVSGGDALDGGAWAVPVATDIAFALGVLAVAGSALPPGVRVLLLSMAVVDDLVAIALIAVVFSTGVALGWLLAGVALCAGFGALIRRGHGSPALLIAVGLAAWVCVHASGVHATVTGILLGVALPTRPLAGERVSWSERVEHRLHPISAGVAVPLFALAAAGIPLAALGDAVGSSVALGVFFGLLAGKLLGILGGSWAAVRLGVARLPDAVTWADVVPVAMLGGVGYTVSLLIARLAFDDVARAEQASAAVLAASVVASVLAVVLLRRRTTAHTA